MSEIPRLSSDKSLRSVKMSTFSGIEPQKRFLRGLFIRYLVQTYGMNINTAYGKFRRGVFKKWEYIGVRECIQLYSDQKIEDIHEYYNRLKVKSGFVKFMEMEMGMSEHTVRKRFKTFDFSELEIKGISNVYNEFIRNIKGD